MIDLGRIEGFDWDEGNSRKSADKHSVSQSEAEQVFLNAPLIAADERHSASEERYHAFGKSDEDRLLHVTFALRHDGMRLRVISARDMNRKERAIYER